MTGRVLSELARPLSEPVSVELNCGLRSLQVIHTDLSGYFTFNLGGGAQSNIDFSASNEGSQMLSPNMQGLPTRYGNPLAGCELRVSVAGYRPRSFPLPHTSDFGRLDVGNLILERIGTMKGSAVSVTSLMVPKEAGKEFEKAVKELQKNKPDAAMPHLEKAVQIYDRYAAAWNEIGRIQLRRNEREKAVAAFEKSTGADPEYLPPLVNLATLYIQNREWEKGVETAGKVLELNPDLGFASFL
ncbi:MAG TPA: tetratricopeptide repeat protein, partial [Terriglobia bacterium]|nr:tetratricopeptide repeat protein [Terriglobia bacterium]